MKPEYQIVDAGLEHVRSILPQLRHRDILDIQRAFGTDVDGGLAYAVDMSDPVWAAVDEEGVIVIWGVGKLSSLGEAQPWLVGTDRLTKKYIKPFLRMTGLFMDLMLEAHPTLEGKLPATDHNWLARCGFRFDVPQGRFYLDARSRQIEQLERTLLQLPQRELPITHHFAPGVYIREMFAPFDTFIIGHEHRVEGLNILLSGRIRVSINGVVAELTAPHVFKSEAGVRKVAYVIEDVRWLNVFATTETDVQKLEEQLIVKSGAYLDCEKEMKRLCPS